VTNLEGYGYMIGVLDLERLRYFHSKRSYAAISILRGPGRSIAYDGSQAPEGRFPQTSREYVPKISPTALIWCCLAREESIRL
jgi:hypothetical protein